MKTPRCPRCKRKGLVVVTLLWRCPTCRGLFDGNPEEGGEFGNTAEARIEHGEAMASRARREVKKLAELEAEVSLLFEQWTEAKAELLAQEAVVKAIDARLKDFT